MAIIETSVNQLSSDYSAAAGTETATSKSNFGLYGYWFLFGALCAGWLLRDQGLVDPEHGVGYWLGIAGGSLMLVLLVYPAGKRSTILRRLGLTRHWFRIHMIFGLVGPLLILYHSNFKYDAFNSAFALYCMVAVAFSGIVGRYFYARIHKGLYGKRTNLDELCAEMHDALANSRGLAVVFPNLINELNRISDELQGDKITRVIGIGTSLAWIIKPFFVRLRLRLMIRKELKVRALESPRILKNRKKMRRTANANAAQFVALMKKTAQISFYERLFSLWHLFHLPLFFLLVVSALVHVLAVHMY
jgi:hypothetical protein